LRAFQYAFGRRSGHFGDIIKWLLKLQSIDYLSCYAWRSPASLSSPTAATAAIVQSSPLIPPPLLPHHHRHAATATVATSGAASLVSIQQQADYVGHPFDDSKFNDSYHGNNNNSKEDNGHSQMDAHCSSPSRSSSSWMIGSNGSDLSHGSHGSHDDIIHLCDSLSGSPPLLSVSSTLPISLTASLPLQVSSSGEKIPKGNNSNESTSSHVPVHALHTPSALKLLHEWWPSIVAATHPLFDTIQY
jgi:hypothetical protein